MRPPLVHLIANAHIDPVWIWDWREGMREVEHTFAAVLDHLDENPDLVFTASSAAYYRWLERVRPDLLDRVRQAVARGSWVVTGGQWVEPDCNLPGGESICRQLLYGQRYLAATFGRAATVGYNIDSYSDPQRRLRRPARPRRGDPRRGPVGERPGPPAGERTPGLTG